MAVNQKSIFIRFSMDDRADKKLYQKLVEESGSAGWQDTRLKKCICLL